MDSVFDPGALLGGSYPVSDGTRVRLRLARCSDAPALAALLGVDEHDLRVRRLVHFDPRRRYVLCATTLLGSGERLVGVGAISFDGAEAAVPDTVVVDDRLEGLRELLAAALMGRADWVAGGRAA